LEVSKLKQCASAIKQDHTNFGISCVHELVDYQEIVIEHSTDIARLKQEAASLQTIHKERFDIQDGSDLLILTNATILTMETGRLEDDLIKNGVLVTRGGIIEHVGLIYSDFSIPVHAQVIDAQGGEFWRLSHYSPADCRKDLSSPGLSMFTPIGTVSWSDTPPNHGKWKLSLPMV